MTDKKNEDRAAEIDAIGIVHTALGKLDHAAQMRVLRYVADAYGLKDVVQKSPARTIELERKPDQAAADVRDVEEPEEEDELDGISSVAIRWIKRNKFSIEGLESIFSLGIDDIDLIASAVPGTSKKQRMHQVFLLKAVSSYLATGAPRVTQEELKEACIHYNAWDNTNAAAYLKSFATEFSGNKEAGYTLNSRGIQAATELLKSMLD